MKLFIWTDPYQVSYGGSSVHVVAKTVAQARKLAANPTKSVSFGKYDNKDDLGNPAAITLGEPTHVLDVPCAIWDYYSE